MSDDRFTVKVCDGQIVVIDTVNDVSVFSYGYDGRLLLECEGLVKIINDLNNKLLEFESKRKVYDIEMFRVIPNVGVENMLTGRVYSDFRSLCKVCNDLCFKNDLLVESFDKLLYEDNQE